MATSTDVKNIIKKRLNQEHLASKTFDSNLDYYISTACSEVAFLKNKYFRDLVKTIYGKTDTEGKFTIEASVVPYQVYIGGEEKNPRGWKRLTPVDYNYFIRVESGSNFVVNYTASFCYSLVPSETGNPDSTTIKLLNYPKDVTIKCLYYPTMPDVSDFPSYFIPLIIEKSLNLFSFDNKLQSPDKYFVGNKDRLKDMEKTVISKALPIESKRPTQSVLNRLTESYLISEFPNDLHFWRLGSFI